jgi:hypothetical protein
MKDLDFLKKWDYVYKYMNWAKYSARIDSVWEDYLEFDHYFVKQRLYLWKELEDFFKTEEEANIFIQQQLPMEISDLEDLIQFTEHNLIDYNSRLEYLKNLLQKN